MRFYKQRIRLIIWVVLTVLLTVLLCEKLDFNKEADVVFHICSNADGVQIEWNGNQGKESDFLITISSYNSTDSIYISSAAKKYKYNNCQHGIMYNISIDECTSKTPNKTLFQRYYLYYDEQKIPKIPTIKINTLDYKDPDNDFLKPPEGSNLWGETIYNNDYCYGTMQYYDAEKKIETNTKIKVRGNTSSSQTTKKSYKLKLDYDCQSESEPRADLNLSHLTLV